VLKNILKNLSLYTLGPAVVGVVTFLLLPIISNYLPPRGQGIIGILETIQRYFIIFATLQIGSGVVRMYMDLDSEAEEKRYAGSIFVFMLMLNAVATVLIGVFLYFFSNTIFQSDDLSFYPFIFLKLIVCSLMIFPILPRGIFVAKQQAAKVFYIKLFSFSVDISFTLYFLVVQNMGVSGVLWANIISNIAVLPILLFYTNKYSTFCFDTKYIKATLLYSLPFVPATLGTATYEHADRYLLQSYMQL
jgi:O-antigen/teichoic acid export membrane protein